MKFFILLVNKNCCPSGNKDCIETSIYWLLVALCKRGRNCRDLLTQLFL